MARSDLLIRLIKSALSADTAQIEKIAEAIIAEERAKQHHVFADRLMMALQSTRPSGPALHSRQGRSSINGDDGKSGLEFIAELTPRRRLGDLILPADCSELCNELVEEQNRSGVLRAHGLEPRHRVLLAGPPGNGKTSLAEAIAFELGASFFVVRYETVIGSFLGETSSRLKRIFDYARITPCVLFFDEFDTLGKERGDTHETGEIKRVVSSLLLQIDDLPSYTVVITATNHPELLDRAVWRRFQLRLELPKPSKKSLEIFFERFFPKFEEDPGTTPAALASCLSVASFAEAEEFCLDILRRHVLSLGEIPLKRLMASRMQHWKARFSVKSEKALNMPLAYELLDKI